LIAFDSAIPSDYFTEREMTFGQHTTRFVLGTMLFICLSGIAAITGADPIADLVAEVSADRLRDHIAALDYPRASEAGLARAALYITQYLESYGYTVSQQPVRYSQNIIAVLPGSVHPEQVFVVGAHFDTVAGTPGADDNASGVAAVLEIARLLADTHPPFTIEFIAFTLEELYMVGSYAYVQDAVQHGKQFTGMICFDMIGYTCETPGCQNPMYGIPDCLTVDPQGGNVGDYAVTLVNDPSAELLTDCDHVAESYIPDLPRVRMQVAANGGCTILTRRSDHVPFWDYGFRAIEFFDTYGDRNPYYHTANDRLSILNMTFCRQITQTALAMILGSSLADIDAPWIGPAGPLADASRAELRLIYPNPTRSSARIRCDLLSPGPLRLGIYDVCGRPVRLLANDAWAEGSRELTWDRTDGMNFRAPDGVYFVRLQSATGTETRKLVLR
jgi:hypothetical protein